MSRINRLKANIALLIGYFFFRSFIFAYVIERLYWRERGISISQTVYLEFIYAAVIIFLEVPSGVWADRFSRSSLIKLSALLNFINAVVLVYAFGFGAFTVAITLSGIYGALSSGSVNALLYDSLKELDRTERFEGIVGRIKAIRYISGLLAALIGSYLAHKSGLITPYHLSVWSCLVSLGFSLLLLEPKRTDVSESHEVRLSAKQIFNESYHLLRGHVFLKQVLLTGALVGSVIIYFEEFWQNYFELIGIKTLYFGWISAIISVGVIVAAAFSGRLALFLRRHEGAKLKVYHLSVLVMMASFLLAGHLKSLWILAAMTLASSVASLNETLVMGDLHHHTPSRTRATMESLFSMLHRAMSVVVGLLFAFLSDRLNVMLGFSGIGVLLLVGWLVLVVLHRFSHESRPIKT